MSAVLRALQQQLPLLPPGGRFVVALSGGRDSMVLLHAMARCRPGEVRAVHVNHGMQAAANEWESVCQTACDALGLPLHILRISKQVKSRRARLGPEAAARQARYAALAAELGAGDYLLTAHHALDQAETLLLQALRGSGVAGMAAMPADNGRRHLRPLLHLTGAQIEQYARRQTLHWVEDPSNSDPALDRARLRQQLWPVIRTHWPAAETTLARSAAHMAEAARLVDELADMDLGQCQGDSPAALDLAAFSELSVDRRRNLLRFWLRGLRLDTPQSAQLAELLRQLAQLDRGSAATALTAAWAGTQLRAYQGQLYAMVRLDPPPADFAVTWPASTVDASLVFDLPGQAGRLQLTRAPGAGLDIGRGPYRLGLRRGGERLQLGGRAHHSRLKQLLQQAAVPPWVRERLPLLLAGERLVAVADWWLDPAFVPPAGQVGWLPEWQHELAGAPPAHIVRERAFG